MNNRLRVLRAEQGWTQADLATRLEVSRQTVNAIETGRFDPSLPLAFRIADLFQRTIEEIFIPERPSDGGRTDGQRAAGSPVGSRSSASR